MVVSPPRLSGGILTRGSVVAGRGHVKRAYGKKSAGFVRHPSKHIRAAIRSEIGDVQKAGSTVVQVTMEEGSLAALASKP